MEMEESLENSVTEKLSSLEINQAANAIPVPTEEVNTSFGNENETGGSLINLFCSPASR